MKASTLIQERHALHAAKLLRRLNASMTAGETKGSVVSHENVAIAARGIVDELEHIADELGIERDERRGGS